MRLLKRLLLLLIWALPLEAQETSPEPIVVPFFVLPPFMELDSDGNRTGFFIDLARQIGAEIQVPLEFVDVGSIEAAIKAQISGRTTMVAGITSLPALELTSLFSDAVATDRVRLSVVRGRGTELSSFQNNERRIGIVPPTENEKDRAVLAGNQAVEFASIEAAILGLLVGEIDALLMAETAVFNIARRAGIDGRLQFADPPIREIDRVVVLHNSRSDLLAPINAAIARMEADGRLEDLRRQYGIVVPPPPPDVLTVGITDFGQYTVVNNNGSFSGFSYDVFVDLAELAALELEFVALTGEEWSRAIQEGIVDALPQLSISSERAAIMDFTLPLERSAFGIFTRAGEASAIRGLDDLHDLTVGVQEVSRSNRDAREAGLPNLLTFGNLQELTDALAAETIDAFLYSVAPVQAEIDSGTSAVRIEMIDPPYLRVDRAIALRPGLGPIRERLNAVIPGYLLSDEFAALRQTYFGEPVFWTPTRTYTLLAGVAATILGLLGYVFWQGQSLRKQRFERQQEELAREQAHSRELSLLIADLERSNRDLDEFAYIASHDLKEPLRGIGINANFLLRENLPGKAGERVLRMGELAGRMERLVSDLLFFSRLGRNDRAREVVQPAQVIQAIRADLAEWLAERGGEIVELGAFPSLKAERLKVKTVLQNLIINGIRYNDADVKRVEIGFLREIEVNGQVLQNAIFVKDNGIGISDGFREKIFRIFSRLNKESDYGGGTGSGLAFVRRIVEEHGGLVDFTSEPGVGSTFYFTLPLANDTT